MKLVCVDPRTHPLWQELVQNNDTDVFHSPAWIQVLTDTYGWDAAAYVLINDTEQPIAGVPFCKVSDMLGERIVILPFSDYCDPIARSGDHCKALFEPLISEHCPVTLRCLHNELPMGDERLSLTKQAKWHGLDLRPDTDTLWASLHDSSRRAIRKAEREGVEVRATEDKDELRAFFNMHLGIRKYKYGLLAQPYEFLLNIWRQFVEKQQGVLMLARYQGHPIGGVLFLRWKNKLYYKFNASQPSHLALRPNDLVIWKGIEYASDSGCVLLDFGLSDWDQEGLVRYKRKLGTEEKTISFLKYAGNQQPTPQEAQMRGLLGQLTELFADPCVPDSITEKAGERLYRFFV